MGHRSCSEPWYRFLSPGLRERAQGSASPRLLLQASGLVAAPAGRLGWRGGCMKEQPRKGGERAACGSRSSIGADVMPHSPFTVGSQVTRGFQGQPVTALWPEAV